MIITFFRIAAKTNAKGLAPIWCRITRNKGRAIISTDVKVLADQWDQINQQVINSDMADSYNNAIIQLKARVFDAYQLLKRTNTPITADAIKLMATKEVEAVLFTRVVEEYRSARIADSKTVEVKNKVIPSIITISTLKNIEYKLNNIKEYLKAIKKSNLLACELRPELLDNYRKWLKATKGSNSDQYANKSLYMWQTLERYAYGKGYIDRLNLLTYCVGKGFGDNCDEVPHLTEMEMESLVAWQPSNLTLQRVKDLFLFQCYTGMAYADSQLFNLSMVLEHDSIPYLKYYRVKLRRKKIMATPLLCDEAQDIIDKYNGQLPKIPNQVYNEWLKLVQAACNIPTNLTSHVGRKTFGMRMLNTFGFKMEEVSRMLGHSSVKMTEKVYAKVTMERVLSAAYSNGIAA